MSQLRMGTDPDRSIHMQDDELSNLRQKYMDQELQSNDNFVMTENLKPKAVTHH